jgi:hypothetical protein
MKKSTTHMLLFILLFLLAGNSLKAQVAALSDLNAGTLAAYCPLDQVKLTSASTGAVSYVWKRYVGTTATGAAVTLAGTTANLTDTPVDPGYYTYVSTGLNADGCESSVSDPVTIYMLPGITASIVSSNPATTQYCSTQLPATLTLTATGGKAQAVPETFAYKYQWYKTGVAITGATASTYTLNSTTDAVVGTNFAYTVRITYVIKACAETTSNAINFDVIATPGKPVITITP